MLKLLSLFVILVLSGCTGLSVPPEFVYTEIATSKYTIASWQKISDNQEPIKIYIEGDGYAFDAFGQPTANPTPHSNFLRKTAFGDKHKNVVYLARPCQFVRDNVCHVTDWTRGRFSSQIVDCEYEAIKKIAQSRPIILVGFSGGAQVAGLVAVKHKDLNIKKLVTVAGNLNVKAWTDYHRLPSLDQSLDLRNYRTEYAKFVQTHYIGANDGNIIPQITLDFVNPKATTNIVDGADHNTGWDKAVRKIQAE